MIKMGEQKGYKGEVTPEMIQARVDSVVSGTYRPAIPGLPGLVFTKMGVIEKGKSARAYSKKLLELMKEGGFIHEAMLPSHLKKAMESAGIPLDITKKQRDIIQRFTDSIPENLAGPIDELTPEEVELLSPEQTEARKEAILARFELVKDWEQSFYTDADREVMATTALLENLETQLRSLTYEHNARAFQAVSEIQTCAKTEDDKPYFATVEDILLMDIESPNLLVELFWQWTTYKKGLNPQFFRPNSPLLTGMVGNVPGGGGGHLEYIPGQNIGVDSQPTAAGQPDIGVHEPVQDSTEPGTGTA
jgi:hypothetical protein